MFCTICGHSNLEDQKYCRKCGAALAEDNPGSKPLSQQLNTTYLDSGDAGGFSSDPSSNLDARPTRQIDPVSRELNPVTGPATLPENLPTQALGETTMSGYETPVPAMPAVSNPTEPVPAPVISSNRSHRGLGISLALAVVLLAGAASVYFLRSSGDSTPNSEDAQSLVADQSQPAPVEQPQATTDAIEPELIDPTLPEPQSEVSPQRNRKGANADKDKDQNGENNAKPNSDKAQTTPQGNSDPMPAAPPPAAPAEPEAPAAPEPTAEEYKKQGLDSLRARQYNEAIKQFRAALRLQPSNADFHYLIAVSYERQGLLKEALAAYKRCQSGTYASLAEQHVKRLSKKLKED